jgi:hypothetical protein
MKDNRDALDNLKTGTMLKYNFKHGSGARTERALNSNASMNPTPVQSAVKQNYYQVQSDLSSTRFKQRAMSKSEQGSVHKSIVKLPSLSRDNLSTLPKEP